MVDFTSGQPIDVLVVGAGPAGLATAIEARMRGLSVWVIDRRQAPIDKPCGEGLMPDGLQRLIAMGVRFGPDQLSPIRGIRYLDGPMVAEAAFPQAQGELIHGVHFQGAGIRRLRLHRALTSRAEELGVELGWRTEAIELDSRTATCRLRVLDDEWPVERTIHARFVVVADGLRSPLRVALGLDVGRRFGVERFGARRHYGIAPWTDHVEVYWGDRAEAYVTPVAPGEVGVAVLWGERKASFQTLIGELPHLEARLRGAPVISKLRGIGPLRRRAAAVVEGRVALVGDAAGYLDAITGEGLSVAFHQAEALAGAMSEGDLAVYSKAYPSIMGLPDAMTQLLLALERRPWLRRRAIRALAKAPSVFERFLAVHCRSRSASSLIPVAPPLLWNLLF